VVINFIRVCEEEVSLGKKWEEECAKKAKLISPCEWIYTTLSDLYPDGWLSVKSIRDRAIQVGDIRE